MIAFNGMGNILIQLNTAIEIITERISIHGNGEGLTKQLVGNFLNDGEEDFGDTYDEPQDEWHQSDASDEDEYRDEWDVEEDDDGFNDSTPEK